MTGLVPAMFVATRVAQYPFWSHGSRYPVSEKPSVTAISARPRNQFISRGFLYAPKTATWNRCAPRSTTIACESKVVEPADDPSGREAVRHVVRRWPTPSSRSARTALIEEQTGGDLDQEDGRERAAEDVRPAGAAHHRLVEHVLQDRAVAEPFVEPRVGAREGAAHPMASRSWVPIRNLRKSTAT